MVLDYQPTMSDENPAAQRQEAPFVQQFLQNVRGTVPLTIEQIDVMLRVIDAARDQVRSFLVIGCDDSLLASAILAEHPDARGFLVDHSDAAIESARGHLRAHMDALRFAKVDFRGSGLLDAVAPGAPFDAIISGSAVQFSTDESRRALYCQAFNLLRPEGIFINLEYVASATRWTESESDDQLIEHIFGPQLRESPRGVRADVARAYYAGASCDSAAPAPLEVQCDWLRAIGFENVECFLKVQEMAMFGGQRAAV